MQKILITFGGRSAEHEVSVNSARNVVAALDRTRYSPILVGIARDGSWYRLPWDHVPQDLLSISSTIPGADICSLMRFGQKICLITESNLEKTFVDVAFPVLHGPYGEDGTIQGLFDMLRLPYVGCGVVASAAAMDKDIFRQVMQHANIPIVSGFTIHDLETAPSYEEAVQKLKTTTLFVKSATMGSSIGVRKVKSAADYMPAVSYALEFSPKAIVERYIPCRELEVAVLGNREPKASPVGEIIPTHEYYSYESKYIDPDGAHLCIPADNLSPDQVTTIQSLAIRAFKAFGGRGMARLDFFMDKEDGTLYLNEANPIPGFTQISMYPKLWIHAGIPYPQLISQLIDLAIATWVEKESINLDPGVNFESNPQKAQVAG